MANSAMRLLADPQTQTGSSGRGRAGAGPDADHQCRRPVQLSCWSPRPSPISPPSSGQVRSRSNFTRPTRPRVRISHRPVDRARSTRRLTVFRASRDAGLLHANSGPAGANVQSVFDVVKPVAATAVNLIRSSAASRPRIFRRISPLEWPSSRTYLDKNAVPDRHLVRGAIIIRWPKPRRRVRPGSDCAAGRRPFQDREHRADAGGPIRRRPPAIPRLRSRMSVESRLVFRCRSILSCLRLAIAIRAALRSSVPRSMPVARGQRAQSRKTAARCREAGSSSSRSTARSATSARPGSAPTGHSRPTVWPWAETWFDWSTPDIRTRPFQIFGTFQSPIRRLIPAKARRAAHDRPRRWRRSDSEHHSRPASPLATPSRESRDERALPDRRRIRAADRSRVEVPPDLPRRHGRSSCRLAAVARSRKRSKTRPASSGSTSGPDEHSSRPPRGLALRALPFPSAGRSRTHSRKPMSPRWTTGATISTSSFTSPGSIPRSDVLDAQELDIFLGHELPRSPITPAPCRFSTRTARASSATRAIGCGRRRSPAVPLPRAGHRPVARGHRAARRAGRRDPERGHRERDSAKT